MRFPLSLKVSAWLLLNLALLFALGAVLLVYQGGFGWDSLVQGPPGRRIQDLAEAEVVALANLSAEERSAELDAFSQKHGVTALLAAQDGRILAGPQIAIPDDLRAPPMIRGGRPALPSLGEPPGRPSSDDGDAPGPRPHPRPDARPQRRLIRSENPSGFWLAVQVRPSNSMPRGAMLVLQVPSLGRLLQLLDLAPWLWLGGGAAAVSLLFWLPFVRGLTRDLGRLTRATEAIAGGRFDTRVPESRRDELGALGGSVNRMAGRLDRLVTGQKRFLGDIAHELGSPLGRMQVSVGILEQRAGPGLQAAVADAREEVAHMADLVGELLAFTQAGLRPRDAALASVPLVPLAARVLAREAADDAVRVDLPADLAVRADPALLSRALGNLVRNALRHAGRSSAITLRAENEGTGFVLLIVEDDGPGVPPDALVRLGEPFFRPESARTRETGGAGLGLAIVKSCAEACGGSVRFENRHPRGFLAILRLARG